MSEFEYNGNDHHTYIDKSDRFFDDFNFCDCRWCKKYGLPILNHIHLESQSRYWFEVPKNASTSIKTAFKPERVCATNSYHSGKLYHELDDDIIPLVVYNDPIKRFISLCNDYFSRRWNNPHSQYGKNIFLRIGALKQNQEIESILPQERVKIIFDNFKEITSSEDVHHFYPQAFFVDQKKFKKFELIPIKDVYSKFSMEGKTWYNKSTPSIQIEHFTDEQIDKLKLIYSVDYNFIEKYS